MSPLPRRAVIKVGGSLLKRPGLPAKLRSFAKTHHGASPSDVRVWIIGGGEAVESLRAIDKTTPLDASTAHRAAINMMDIHASLLAEWLPEAALTRDWRRLTGTNGGDWVFAPGRFLAAVEPSLPGTPLPIGWEVTSDSIAARVAEALGARLSLLKSRPPNNLGDFCASQFWHTAACEGYVDAHFPIASAGVVAIEAVTL